ncbi:MAG: phospholipase D-like domain-containing protein [Candidatus Methanoplasma sp.]|nr:phospholipase D-like domain-containing protein [Candidatus Methanoplasma sp.]
MDGVLLYEVNPYGNYEGVSLFNYGSEKVNLKGWSITDIEGTLTFIADTYIESNSRLTITKAISEDDWFSGRENVLTVNDPGLKKEKTFTPADGGDDIFLYRGGTMVDAICYGSKRTDSGWNGEPVKISSGKYILRIGSQDTNSSSDWIATKPGLTNNAFDPNLYFDAYVTPFSFPESQGEPIFKAIEDAKEEVLISIYLLTSVPMVALLCDLSEKGVDVNILLEGDILGNMGSSEIPLMRSLVDSGGDVYFINDSISGNFERYAYVHNKYAVIDQETVVVTSENWTADNLGSKGNRGWGAAIESREYAEYVKQIFLNDVDTTWGDVQSLSGRYPDAKPYSGNLTYGGSSSSYQTTTYEARVMPSFSPDNSYSTLRYFIDNAEDRVYSQQLDLGSSYQTITDASPIKWMSSAAERGVDAKFMLDASIDKNAVTEVVNTINNTTDIEAIALDGRKGVFSMIHNKGVVIDDVVWVASVNWTENSFMNNREVAVIIDSPEVAEFFTGLFMEDWGTNQHSILKITHEVLHHENEAIHTFTASGPEDSTYIWNLGNGDLRTTAINKIVLKDLPEGDHTISVTIEETGQSASHNYSASAEEEKEEAGSDNNLIMMAGAGVFAAIGALIMFIRKNINR